MKKLFREKTIDEQIKFNKVLQVILMVEMAMFVCSFIYSTVIGSSMNAGAACMFCSLLCISCSLSEKTKKLVEQKNNSEC